MHQKYRRIQLQRLRFPPHLKFTLGDDGLLECNGQLVQVVPSLPIKQSDNPPVDFPIFGIGVFNFEITDADVYILSFINAKVTDCAILLKDELKARLKPYHYEGDKTNLKLITTSKGQLMECFNYGSEGFYMALWLDDSRNFTEYHNNWDLFS